MQIDIQSHDFTNSKALAVYAGRRLRFALAHAGDHVWRVAMDLTYVNDRQGEIGQYCRVQVMMDRAATVVVEDIEADIYRAIDRAADRAGRTVMRRLARQSVDHGKKLTHETEIRIET